MHCIHARNVNDAWAQALSVMDRRGVSRPSRAGDVLVVPEPVATTYKRPTERVLFDPTRDANPIFHLHEALWMLAGRDDARWLDQFVGDFSSRFAEPDGHQHGAYGYRWRQHFTRFTENDHYQIDQLDEAVRLLRADPHDRQAVIQMWDPAADLGVPDLRDRPCNTTIFLRADRQTEHPGFDANKMEFVDYRVKHILDMTVCCRSNDVVWGCYGANAVHMSVLQEYLAARCGFAVGTYTQVSNNWHMYEATRSRADLDSAVLGKSRRYPGTSPLVDDPDTFDEEVRRYVDDPYRLGPVRNTFLANTARPMFLAHQFRKDGAYGDALDVAATIRAPDWREATTEWLKRRAVL